jgi:hypothetical protein
VTAALVITLHHPSANMTSTTTSSTTEASPVPSQESHLDSFTPPNQTQLPVQSNTIPWTAINRWMDDRDKSSESRSTSPASDASDHSWDGMCQWCNQELLFGVCLDCDEHTCNRLDTFDCRPCQALLLEDRPPSDRSPFIPASPRASSPTLVRVHEDSESVKCSNPTNQVMTNPSCSECGDSDKENIPPPPRNLSDRCFYDVTASSRILQDLGAELRHHPGLTEAQLVGLPEATLRSILPTRITTRSPLQDHPAKNKE